MTMQRTCLSLTSYFMACPYCMEQIEVVVDSTAGSQEYTEDCEVCCNPIIFKIVMDGARVLNIEAEKENA